MSSVYKALHSLFPPTYPYLPPLDCIRYYLVMYILLRLSVGIFVLLICFLCIAYIILVP